MTWDKALMNAIIHQGIDPRIKGIRIACDKCGCKEFFIPYEKSISIDDHTRVSMYINRCVDCGADELNCTGTYYLPDLMPGTILPFIGHFMSLWAELAPRLKHLEQKSTEPDMSTSDGICLLGGTPADCKDDCAQCVIYQQYERR